MFRSKLVFPIKREQGILSLSMYQLRTIILRSFFAGISGILCLPIFVFAQVTTTVAEQPKEEISPAIKAINDMADSRMKSLLEMADVHTNAISKFLVIRTTPTNPGPNTKVTVSLESYLSNLDKANITWTLNGAVASRGIGKSSFSFQTGASGKTTNLTVTIVTNDGSMVVKNLSWTPVGITLFWEADTYTPPFYRGKPLLTPQARVKLVATPDSTGSQNALDAGKLVYVWEEMSKTSPEASGYGKNTFIMKGPKPYDETNVKVRVSSVDDTMNSESRVFLTLSDPFILFYDKNPLLGVLYNKPFTSALNLTKKEFSLSAEPYFFSNERGDEPTLDYTWSVNGGKVQNSGRNITLQRSADAKGAANISLEMRGMRETFQKADQNLRVNFAETTSTARPSF